MYQTLCNNPVAVAQTAIVPPGAEVSGDPREEWVLLRGGSGCRFFLAKDGGTGIFWAVCGTGCKPAFRRAQWHYKGRRERGGDMESEPNGTDLLQLARVRR